MWGGEAVALRGALETCPPSPGEGRREAPEGEAVRKGGGGGGLGDGYRGRFLRGATQGLWLVAPRPVELRRWGGGGGGVSGQCRPQCGHSGVGGEGVVVFGPAASLRAGSARDPSTRAAAAPAWRLLSTAPRRRDRRPRPPPPAGQSPRRWRPSPSPPPPFLPHPPLPLPSSRPWQGASAARARPPACLLWSGPRAAGSGGHAARPRAAPGRRPPLPGGLGPSRPAGRADRDRARPPYPGGS